MNQKRKIDTPEAKGAIPGQQVNPLWVHVLVVFFLLLTVVVTFLTAFVFTPWAMKQLGWIAYPTALFVIPSVGAGFGFFVLFITICERLGIIELNKPNESQQSASESDLPYTGSQINCVCYIESAEPLEDDYAEQ